MFDIASQYLYIRISSTQQYILRGLSSESEGVRVLTSTWDMGSFMFSYTNPRSIPSAASW